jgi:hypothetical protein
MKGQNRLLALTALLHGLAIAKGAEPQSVILQSGQGGPVTRIQSATCSSRECVSKTEARFVSPRYLEEHPELYRVPSSARGGACTFKPDQVAQIRENTALAKSPRFREAHPELRWSMSSTAASAKGIPGQTVGWTEPRQNKATKASPRFLEEHPELLRGQPVFGIAPLFDAPKTST